MTGVKMPEEKSEKSEDLKAYADRRLLGIARDDKDKAAMKDSISLIYMTGPDDPALARAHVDFLVNDYLKSKEPWNKVFDRYTDKSDEIKIETGQEQPKTDVKEGKTEGVSRYPVPPPPRPEETEIIKDLEPEEEEFNYETEQKGDFYKSLPSEVRTEMDKLHGIVDGGITRETWEDIQDTWNVAEGEPEEKCALIVRTLREVQEGCRKWYNLSPDTIKGVYLATQDLDEPKWKRTIDYINLPPKVRELVDNLNQAVSVNQAVFDKVAAIVEAEGNEPGFERNLERAVMRTRREKETDSLENNYEIERKLSKESQDVRNAYLTTIARLPADLRLAFDWMVVNYDDCPTIKAMQIVTEAVTDTSMAEALRKLIIEPENELDYGKWDKFTDALYELAKPKPQPAPVTTEAEIDIEEIEPEPAEEPKVSTEYREKLMNDYTEYLETESDPAEKMKMSKKLADQISQLAKRLGADKVEGWLKTRKSDERYVETVIKTLDSLDPAAADLDMLARRYADAHIELACGYESDKESSKSFATRLGELTDTDVLKLNLNPAELELFGITTSIALQSNEGFDLIMPLYKFLRGETLIEIGTRNIGTFAEQRGIRKVDAYKSTEKMAEARKTWPEKLKDLQVEKAFPEFVGTKEKHDVSPPPGPPMGVPKAPPKPAPPPMPPKASKPASAVPPLPKPIGPPEPPKAKKADKKEGEMDD
jgi:hypothetical protein